jgi:late competence protein required for DNA uptake (superfamily II DNA/RNA helicase)
MIRQSEDVVATLKKEPIVEAPQVKRFQSLDDIAVNAKTSAELEKELECPLCFRMYHNPVTTPCGHTYCRTCLYSSLKYSQMVNNSHRSIC